MSLIGLAHFLQYAAYLIIGIVVWIVLYRRVYHMIADEWWHRTPTDDERVQLFMVTFAIALLIDFTLYLIVNQAFAGMVLPAYTQWFI